MKAENNLQQSKEEKRAILLENLVDELYKRIDERFWKNLNDADIEFCKTGRVTSVDDNGNYSVDLGNVVMDDLKNLSGDDTVTVNSKVKVFFENFNMKNAYIGLKM